ELPSHVRSRYSSSVDEALPVGHCSHITWQFALSTNGQRSLLYFCQQAPTLRKVIGARPCSVHHCVLHRAPAYKRRSVPLEPIRECGVDIVILAHYRLA